MPTSFIFDALGEGPPQSRSSKPPLLLPGTAAAAVLVLLRLRWEAAAQGQGRCCLRQADPWIELWAPASALEKPLLVVASSRRAAGPHVASAGAAAPRRMAALKPKATAGHAAPEEQKKFDAIVAY